MNILKIARYGLKTVSVIAVQQVVDNVIVATMPEIVSAKDRIMTRIGGAVISAYIGDSIATYVTRELDELFANIKKATQSDENKTDGEPVVINVD